MSEVSFREINKIAIPAILAGISEPLIALGDTAILGRLPDSEIAVSGIAGATTFYLTIVWVLAQTKSATSALVSRALGQKKLESVKALVPQVVLLSMFMGLVFYFGTVPFIEQVMELYQLKGQALSYSMEYYEIRAAGFPLILAAFTIFGVFRGLQNTFWAMVISISGSLLNLLLDLMLVHGVEGFIDPMGVKGAAWASLIVQAWMFLAAIVTLLWKTPFSLRIKVWKAHEQLGELMGIAGNLFIRTIILNFTIFLAGRSATGISDAHNTAHTMAYQLWLFAAFFIDGYSNAANAISGKLLGAKNFSAMDNMVKNILKYNIVIASILALVMGALYFQIGHWLSNNAYVVELFESFFWLVLIIFPINALAFTLDGVFKGLGEAKFLSWVLFIATLLAFIPVLFIGNYFEAGLIGIWLAMLAWIILRGVLPWLRFKRMINHSVNQINT